MQLVASPTPNPISKISYEKLNANACNHRGNRILLIYTQSGPLFMPVHNCTVVRESILLVKGL
jgi:hypothetical protein